ncbi:hypothetical protein IWW57_004254 [Coemansia sp. S610]|nr:hypothetical protein IWW57_004254 [Coemansia sp. S610]KAJ2413522.1 hypothetical protein GGI10_003005 [Coemansia sp. RSA 2530]KAJ2697070.1 hypothetical protein H4218_004200 [Coemansia sp. IMI 209128]
MASAHTFVPNPVKLTGRSLKVMQPNYTLAIRLGDQSLRQELAKFYEHVRQEHPKYRKYLVMPEKLMLPIASMHLGSQASIDAACSVLEHSNDLVKKHLTASPVVHYKGLKSNGSGTVISTRSCIMPAELAGLARDLRLRFWSLGYVANAKTMPKRTPFFEDNVIPDGTEWEASCGKLTGWKPQITLIRLHGTDLARKMREATASFKSATKHNKGVVVENGVSRKITLNDFFGIPESALKLFEQHDFGSQTVDRLDLLSLVNNDGPVQEYPSRGQLCLNF